MQINIALSAGTHNFKRGDRVICKVDKDEWYTGTVTRAGAKVHVDFDDDFDAVIDENDFKHIKALTTPKKSKRALSDAQMKILTAPIKPKAAPKPVPPSPPPKPVRKRYDPEDQEDPEDAPAPKGPKPSQQVRTRPTAPVRTPANTPAPKATPKAPKASPTATPEPAPAPVSTKPVEEPDFTSNWQLFLIPDAARANWNWAAKYDTKKGDEIPKSGFKSSNAPAPTALQALQEAMKEISVPVFTLHYVDEMEAGKIKRATVTKDVGHSKAEELVTQYARLEQQNKPPSDVVPDSPAPAPAPTGGNPNQPASVRIGHDPNSEMPVMKTKPLYLQMAEPALFKAAQGEDKDQAKMKYMKTVWEKANRTLFSGMLQTPRILRFLKEQATDSFRRRGHWVAQKRELAISRRVFNAGENQCLLIFIHEMCHQAVSEIDKKVDINKGHGPYWKAWMAHVEIPPDRYDYTPKTEYMNEEEKEKHQEVQDRNKAFQEEEKARLSPDSSIGASCRFYTSQDGWRQGVFAGPSEAPGKGAVITVPTGDRWFEVPYAHIYDLVKDDWKLNYASSQWQDQAKKVAETIARKKKSLIGRPDDYGIGKLLGL